MKLFGFVVLLFALQFCKARKISHGNRGLLDEVTRESDINKDFDEIIALVPRTQIEDIVKNWISKDQEVKNDVAYATSNNFKQRVKKLENSKEFQAVRSKLEAAHINIPHFANIIHEYIGFELMPASSDRRRRSNAGLRGCLDEIRSIIPMPQIILNLGKKYLISTQFQDFVHLLKDQNYKKSLRTLFNSEVVNSFINDAEAHDVDMKAIYDFIDSLSPIYNALMEKS